MRKAAGTNYIPKQARELKIWVDRQKLEQELYRGLEKKEAKEDELEILVDSIGQAIAALAIVLGLILLVVNIPRSLEWW